jgi:type IV pilus assembly protein PilY1
MKNILRTLLVAAAAFVALPSHAAFDPVGEDIDIFLANPSFEAERPNVLLMLDNTANWNTAFDNEKAALVTVVNGLTSSFNVGLMFFNESGNDVNHGSFVKFGVRQMTDTNKTALTNMVNALDRLNDKGNNNTVSEMMHEAYLYWGGLTAYSGFGQVKRDYAGNTANNSHAASLPGNAFASATSQTYVSPIVNGCQKNFQIFISNGPANENSATLSDMQSKLSAIVGKSPPDTITLSNTSPNSNSQQGNWMDEFARFMANGDCNANFDGTQSVITYVVEVDPSTSGQGPGMTTLLKSVASNGKGKYFAVTSSGGAAAIVTVLNQIFQEVQSVNSVFASTTLPVSVNVRGTNLNQVYIGVFRPDATKSPRWFGNLKLYNLKVDSATGNLFLSDATGTPAANASTGFIANTATSFWTHASTFWSFRDGTYASTDVGQASDSPDGDLVEKGGAAQRLRDAYPTDHSTRKLYTCTGPCACAGNTCATAVALSDSPFSTANANVTALTLGTLSTKPVTSLTSSGTLATAVSAAHGFATNDGVQIAGASPSGYNGTYTITVVDANTFTYTLSSSPAGNTATVAATAHGLSSGDLLDVTGSAQAGYNVTGSAVTRVDANSFTYTLGGAVVGASAGHTVVGRKLVTGLTGIGTTATVSLPGHGYSSGNTITISGATPNEFNVTKTITVTSTDAFTYQTNSSFSGSSATAQVTTTAPHNLTTGATVTINCASPTAYNQSAVITVNGTNTFTYTVAGGAQSTDATVTTAPGGCTGVSNIQVTSTGVSSNISSISGSGTTATVTTTAAHGFAAGNSITISGVTPTEYNGTFNIVSVPTSTTFTYTTTPPAGPGSNQSSTGTITSTVGSDSVSRSTAGTLTTAKNSSTTGTLENGNSDLPTSFVAGATVIISGASPAGFNGTWKITSRAANGRSITMTYGDLAGLPTPTLSSASASGSLTRLVANNCGGGTSACLQRAFAATGSIYAGKTVTATSITSQTNATGTITAANVTAGDATARASLINWVRSQDNKDDENADSSLTGVRASVHGDVLHSRPAVVNYNRGGVGGSNAGDDDVFAFYGGNDGILHAVQGGFAANGGLEAWGFVAPEFFSKLKRLRDNTPLIGQSSATASPRDYYFDGPIGVYTLDVGSDGAILASQGDKVYLFIGMRRGGRYIYALDVSDPNNPKFMWKRGCPNLYNADGSANNTGCDAGFEELGQTWSEAKVMFLRAYSNPVLVFGAGYDPAVEDIQPCLVTDNSGTGVTYKSGGSVTHTSTGTCTTSGTTPKTVNRVMGRGLFFVDATNGTLLYRIGPDAGANKQVTAMQYAIAADPVVLNRDRDNTRTLPGRENLQPLLSGFADRVYAVDTGGQVWRVDVDDASTANWQVTRIANLSGSAVTDKRKFLFSPDVVFGSDGNGNYDAILLGSGDREHPFDATVTNRFYMLKDRNTGVSVTSHTTIVDTTYNASTAPSGLFDATNNCLQDTAVCA